ncbi:LAQU0S24e00430g1_1 [Lachancea quebecensis]|uniref:LAQU0S24e00430g1_1 n=1 Tax=Lachancea quebecensis TaxID=1654605 RepID=A0A0P1L595_9SACH|nr:LAQU0S24e00430g1_1 [Lachancea quebecensis]
MSFISKLLRLGKNASKSLPEQCDYAKWSKEDLVRKVMELEAEKKRKAEDEGDQSDNKPKKVKREDLPEKKRRKKKDKPFDFSKYDTRFVAFKFAYLGWNYNGLAIQKEPTPLPTVEGTILEAMNACKLVPSMVPQDYNFSRCGRTDKGVSAMNQVISLNVRSNLTKEEQQDKNNDDKEIDYVHILNQLLPDDIRISAVCLHPPKNFDARFSCQNRHYRYLFHKDGLDIKSMEEAARMYEGEHDFRNFCKLDGSKQINNYKRNIERSQIIPLGENIYCLDLIGSAFLWHQVRCMMANLFLIGQGLEHQSLLKDLMDVGKVMQKPIYDMASDIPLILFDCKFPEMEWRTADPHNFKSLQSDRRVYALSLDYNLKSTVANIFRKTLCVPTSEIQGRTRINLGDGKGKVVAVYQKMLERGVMDSVESVNQKFRDKKAAKKRRRVPAS